MKLLLMAFAGIATTANLHANVVEVKGEEKIEMADLGGEFKQRLTIVYTNLERDGKIVLKGVRFKAEILNKGQVSEAKDFKAGFDSVVCMIEGAEVAEISLQEKPQWWVRASFPISVECISGLDCIAIWIVAPSKNFVEYFEIKDGKVSFPMEDDSDTKAKYLRHMTGKMEER